MTGLTKAEVLRAVSAAVTPWSGYIGDRIARDRRSRGEPVPTVSLVLRRLRQLEADGLLECSGFTRGYYGFEWSITPAGRTALEAEAEAER